MAYTTPDPKELDLSQKELLLMRLSQHIEQAQIDSPAYFLSNLALKGTEELVNEFLCDQPSVNDSSVESFLQSQLYVSCFWGLYDIVKILIDNKADVNYKNSNTLWTPLHAATFQDHGRVVMLLLENDANALSQDYKGRTPADFASVSDKIWSHFDVMKIKRTSNADLIKKGILQGSDKKSNDLAVLQSPQTKDNLERTKSGIKLADYSGDPSKRETGSTRPENFGSRSTSVQNDDNIEHNHIPVLSRLSESEVSQREFGTTPTSSLNSYTSAAQSTVLGREYGFTPLSSRSSKSRSSVSDSSQMKSIIGGVGDITVESPIGTSRSSRYGKQKSSSSMSSILSWQ